jgi:hypothetical protein
MKFEKQLLKNQQPQLSSQMNVICALSIKKNLKLDFYCSSVYMNTRSHETLYGWLNNNKSHRQWGCNFNYKSIIDPALVEFSNLFTIYD